MVVVVIDTIQIALPLQVCDKEDMHSQNILKNLCNSYQQ